MATRFDFFQPAESHEQQQRKACDILRTQFNNVADGLPIDTRALASLEQSSAQRKDTFSLSVQTNCYEAHTIELGDTFSPKL